MKKMIIIFMLLFAVSTLSLAEEETKNQISIMGGINFVNESGSTSEYEAGINDFPITPSHKSYTIGFSYARFISGNLGVEMDFRYHLKTQVTVVDPSDQEGVDIDTFNNYSITGNLIYKFSGGFVQPYFIGGAGMNILSTYEKEFTSDLGSVIIITAPEKTSNLVFNVGGGVILAFSESGGLRLDLRYSSISDLDTSGIQVLGGAAFRF